MNILAINSSPRGKIGHTDFMLQNLLMGMRQADNTVETIYLNQLNIRPCHGCVSCWFKTPGKCIYDDDMRTLLLKIKKADLIIYATPLYVFSMTGLMKNFLDRTLPLASPFFVENKNDPNLTAHPKRDQNNTPKKIFLVSSAAFPEMKHFEPLVHTFKYYVEASGGRYLGEILKPASELLRDKNRQDQVAIYAKNLQLAGEQLVERDVINPDLLSKLHEPWASPKAYREYVNSMFQEMLKHIDQEN